MSPLLALVWALAGTNAGIPDADLLRQAEEAFRLGAGSQARVQQARRHFSQAADLFGALERRGVRSPALYLDLGNAAFLAGQPARALWAYHCGLRLDPNDRRLREHLTLVRARLPYPPGLEGPPADAWPPGLSRPTPRGALFTACLSYPLVCLLATLWLRRRDRRLLGACLALLAVLGGSLGTFGWLSARAEHDTAHPLVIVAEETPLYRGNGPSYPTHPDVPTLPPGLEARELRRRGGWLQVQLTGGATGWIPAAAALVVN